MSAVHPPLVAGIYGRKETGARSVVLAGHFEDEDYGDHLYVYWPISKTHHLSPLIHIACISEVVVERPGYASTVLSDLNACLNRYQGSFWAANRGSVF